MNDQIATTRGRTPTREVASAEAQIATADEQISEIQTGISEAEAQIEAMEDEIGKRKRFIRGEARRLQKLIDRRSVFIEASAALRKLDRP
jgi:multidrug resistance efflux pump